MYIYYFYIWIEIGVTSVTTLIYSYSLKVYRRNTPCNTCDKIGVTGVTANILGVTLSAFFGVTPKPVSLLLFCFRM